MTEAHEPKLKLLSGEDSPQTADISTREANMFARPSMRFVGLVLFCFMILSSYWCYDIPSALKPDFVARYGEAKFGMLYYIFNFLNIITVMCGGLFIDLLGLRLGAMVFCFMILLGQTIISIGASMDNYHTGFIVLLIGRIVYSLGGDTLFVAKSCFLAKWFVGKELALAFGVTLSFSRLGGSLTLILTSLMGQKWGFAPAVWVGTIISAFSLVFTCISCAADKSRDKVVETKKVNVGGSFRFSDVLHFPASVWLLSFICATYYAGVFTFISVCGSTFIRANYGFSAEDTMPQTIVSAPYLMAAFLAPIIGLGIDRFGKRTLALTASGCSVLVAFFILILVSHDHGIWVPLVAMVFLGVAYSLMASCLCPSMSLVVEEKYAGTAFSLLIALQNCGIGVASFCVSYLPQTESTSLYVLIAFVLVGVILSVSLTFYDKSHGNVLYLSSLVPKGDVAMCDVSPVLSHMSVTVSVETDSLIEGSQ